MTNHFHLLLGPEPGQSVSRILQSLTVAHTWHYHRSQRSSGHVWQGRFKSPVVQDDDHALILLRYIEANPSGGDGDRPGELPVAGENQRGQRELFGADGHGAMV
jgi:REP element-mobilizing transposase RayT